LYERKRRETAADNAAAHQRGTVTQPEADHLVEMHRAVCLEPSVSRMGIIRPLGEKGWQDAGTGGSARSVICYLSRGIADPTRKEKGKEPDVQRLRQDCQAPKQLDGQQRTAREHAGPRCCRGSGFGDYHRIYLRYVRERKAIVAGLAINCRAPTLPRLGSRCLSLPLRAVRTSSRTDSAGSWIPHSRSAAVVSESAVRELVVGNQVMTRCVV